LDCRREGHWNLFSIRARFSWHLRKKERPFQSPTTVENAGSKPSQLVIQFVELPLRQEHPVVTGCQSHLDLVLCLGAPTNDLAKLQMYVDEIVRRVFGSFVEHRNSGQILAVVDRLSMVFAIQKQPAR
jgi:hypothetical protein